MNLTSEQIEIVNCQFNNILLINAFAGTGKTTTLVEFCKSRPNDKILYLCYNRGLKEEAVEKFKNLKNVKVSTIHSIAYKEIGHNYSQKLGNLRPYDLAKYFHGDIKYYYGYYILLILKDFLNSGDSFEIYFKNLDNEIDNILKGFNGKYNSNILIKAFSNIWKDLLYGEKLKIEHDVYLKLYQLSKTDLSQFDYILVDEAQDVNGCMLDIILKQKTKKVFIGDSFQQIYQWRGSKNTFKILENENDKVELSLTGSFRCAKNITDIANQYLKFLGAKKEIQGLNKKRTNLDNQTFIGRTNAGIMKHIIKTKGNVFYVGGFDSYNFTLLLDINYLYNNNLTKINSSFIKLFSNFGELKIYSEEGRDQEIKTMIKLFEEIIGNTINIKDLRGVENIEELVQLLKKESITDYLYSTYAVSSAHKSKGLEWENIVLLDDFENINQKLKEIENLSGEQKQEKLEKLLEEIKYFVCSFHKSKTKNKYKGNFLNSKIIKITVKIMQDSKQIIFYKSQTGNIKINVFLKDETLWLSQKMMAELFGVQENNITYHIKEIYNSGELENNSTTQKIGVVQKEGNREVKRNIDFYNLDVIIAVGYRVNSIKATQFRIWATNVLKEFIIKGFVMDDERLRNGDKFGKKYFEELLERIRDIRTSERIFYQKLTDLYSLSADYNKDSETTKQFFATIQNKLHFAISGNTAAEIIYDRVDSKKANMGLTSWKDSPKGKIMKSDVSIAKNYLDEKEIKSLNLLVNAYLDIAEMQAMDEQIMTMEDWKERIDDFLKGVRKNILSDPGKITAKLAKEKAEKEYDKFKPKQDLLYKNDFDILLEKVKQKKMS